MIFDRINASIDERLRHMSRTRTIDRLLHAQKLEGPWLDSLELLQTLLSIKAILPSSPAILVDIGAHCGAFARGADRILGFERILCVEPDETLIPLLEETVKQTGASIHRLALSDNDGESQLHVFANRSLNSLVKPNGDAISREFGIPSAQDTSTQLVRTLTLDHFLDDVKLAPEGDIFLKLDTQGNELDILRGGTATLKRVSACLLEFMFCSPYATSFSFAELVQFMDDAGFECKGALNVLRKPTHKVSGVDFLFTKK